MERGENQQKRLIEIIPSNGGSFGKALDGGGGEATRPLAGGKDATQRIQLIRDYR